MEDLRLITIWSKERNCISKINFHSHKYHELVYYPSGQGATTIGDKTFSFKNHTFSLIPQHTEHNEIHYEASQVICLGFTGAELSTGFCADPELEIFKILKDMLREVSMQKYGFEKMLTIKLNELLLYISRNKANTSHSKTFDYIINYIRENYHEHMNLCDFAKLLNISYDYFQHKFKLLTGYSPQQFLMEQRLNAAREMLDNTQYNCTEIAYRCGFSTSAQFSSLFKKKFGDTPLQYRNRKA